MEIRNILCDNCIRANSYVIQWLCFQKYKLGPTKHYYFGNLMQLLHYLPQSDS
jgi:hypothetical protein